MHHENATTKQCHEKHVKTQMLIKGLKALYVFQRSGFIALE
jgi:hypothetical protein